MRDLDDSKEGVGRAKHDCRDIGGRVMPGAITEEARAEWVRFYSGHTACLFQTQAKYLRPCRQGAPTVGALGNDAMDENGSAIK